MAVYLIDKIKPKNGGSFPMVDAQDVLMPDGTRLSDLGSGLPDVTYTDILPETQIEFQYEAELGCAFYENNPSPFALIAGAVYFVEINGEVYKETAKAIEGYPVVYAGDDGPIAAMAGGEIIFNGDAPFCMAYFTTDNSLSVIYNAQENVSATVHIYQCVEDGKYLGVNGGQYGLGRVRAEEVVYKDGVVSDFLPVKVTQEEYDALVAEGEDNPNTPYMIVG